jgi:hypothetical protein
MSCIFRTAIVFESAEGLQEAVFAGSSRRTEGRVNTMLIVTTIYSMELETAKKLSAPEPGEETVEAKVSMEDREFLGIYQGMTMGNGGPAE